MGHEGWAGDGKWRAAASPVQCPCHALPSLPALLIRAGVPPPPPLDAPLPLFDAPFPSKTPPNFPPGLRVCCQGCRLSREQVRFSTAPPAAAPAQQRFCAGHAAAATTCGRCSVVRRCGAAAPGRASRQRADASNPTCPPTQRRNTTWRSQIVRGTHPFSHSPLCVLPLPLLYSSPPWKLAFPLLCCCPCLACPPMRCARNQGHPACPPPPPPPWRFPRQCHCLLCACDVPTLQGGRMLGRQRGKG